jgi:transcriptional regulator with XRE-family HTH domain
MRESRQLARLDVEAPSVRSHEEKEALAKRLREAREYLGLSQEYVAQQTGIPRPAISEIEAARRKVDSLELKRFSKLYGRPVEFLLGDLDESTSEAVGAASDPVELKLRSMTKDLKKEDREEIVRFVEYLRHRSTLSERK